MSLSYGCKPVIGHEGGTPMRLSHSAWCHASNPLRSKPNNRLVDCRVDCLVDLVPRGFTDASFICWRIHNLSFLLSSLSLCFMWNTTTPRKSGYTLQRTKKSRLRSKKSVHQSAVQHVAFAVSSVSNDFSPT